MYRYLSVYLSVCLPACLPGWLPACLPAACLPVCLYIYIFKTVHLNQLCENLFKQKYPIEIIDNGITKACNIPQRELGNPRQLILDDNLIHLYRAIIQIIFPLLQMKSIETFHSR